MTAVERCLAWCEADDSRSVEFRHQGSGTRRVALWWGYGSLDGIQLADGHGNTIEEAAQAALDDLMRQQP